MIAQFFDDDAARGDLSSIKRLEIDSGSEAEAFYLAAWLAVRLGWRQLDSTRGFQSPSGTPIAFTHRVRGDRRRVLRIAITTNASQYNAEVTDDDATVVSLSVKGAHPRSRWLVPLQRIDNLSLIERAILTPSIDMAFCDALAIAEQIATHDATS